MDITLSLAWLGGIIDGEGSLGVFQHVQVRNGTRYEAWRPVIAITNTNPLIIHRCIDILQQSGLSFSVHTHKPDNPRWKARTNIQIVGIRHVARAAPVLRPYVYAKAANLELLERLAQSRLRALKGPRPPRKGGGSHHPTFTEADLEVVAELQRLNAVGPRCSDEEIV